MLGICSFWKWQPWEIYGKLTLNIIKSCLNMLEVSSNSADAKNIEGKCAPSQTANRQGDLPTSYHLRYVFPQRHISWLQLQLTTGRV
jgi:hypothetical protein